MQDEVRSKRLRVRRVKSEVNVADLGTKPFSKAVSVHWDMSTGPKKVLCANCKTW